VFSENQEDFSTRMRILGFMIKKKKPVTPKQINEGCNINHYPTVLYHLKRMIEHGVIIPHRGNKYSLQPFMVDKNEINKLIKEAINKAFEKHRPCHLVDSCKECSNELVLETFKNAFLYYLKYLLNTGDF